jgi:Xaa-Pro aminopeptidase
MAAAEERARNSVSTAELERRWQKVRAGMREAKLEALVVQGANNFAGGGGYFRWLTGIPPSGTYPQTVIFPADKPMTVVHHGDFNGDAKLDPAQPATFGLERRLTAPSFPAIEYTRFYDAELAAKAIKGAGYRRLGLVGGFMMYHGFASRLLELISGTQVEDATGMLDEIKAVKSEWDIGEIRRAAEMQDEIFARVCKHAKPGMHDYDVMAYSDYVGNLLGGETGYFLGSSSPPDQPALFRMKAQHGRRIGEGDVLVWQAENTGPGGFFAHLCRYIVFGKAPQKLVDAYGAAIEGQKFTLGLLKPGASCREIFSEYNNYMRGRGFPEEKRLHCHGQGYENVERPLIRNDESMTIKPGMNIGVHPITGGAVTVCDNFLTGTGVPERLHKTPYDIVEL